jgi:amino acid transporter
MRDDSGKGGVKLRRFLGLTDIFMLSLTGMIGSAWLFSALGILPYAGPAAILTWIIAGILFVFMVFGFGELGGVFPFSGSLARYNHYTHGIFSNYLLS